MSMFGGMRVISDPNCLVETTARLFPVSRHRSARIHKKLVKRHGGEFRKEPAAFRLANGTIICHPAIYLQIRANTTSRP